MRRWILGVLGVTSAAVFLLLSYAIVEQQVLTPKRAVAIVGTVEIPFADFDKAVRYQRVQLMNEYQSYYKLMQYIGTQKEYQDRLDQIEVQLDNPVDIGRETLQYLIRRQLVQQQAQIMGIAISHAEVEKKIQSMFGYDPSNIPSTANPSPTLEPLLTPTAGTPSTPFPTSTPYTEQAFQELYSDFIDNLSVETRMTEANIKQLFKFQLLADKVRDEVTRDVTVEEEHVNARHILLGLMNRELALDVLERVLAGEDFAELANEFSIDTASASDGGELGWFPRGGLIAPLDKIVFDSEIEIVTTLVETQFGYHIVEVLGREIRRVQEEIVRQRRSETYEQWMAEVYDSSVVNTFDWWESKVPTEPTLEQYFRNQQQQ